MRISGIICVHSRNLVVVQSDIGGILVVDTYTLSDK